MTWLSNFDFTYPKFSAYTLSEILHANVGILIKDMLIWVGDLFSL